MNGVLRGVVAALVGVLISASPVSAAETVVTAQVAPVRHVVVNDRGVILQIISNTSEDVTPITHLNHAQGEQVVLTDEIRARYEKTVARLDMSKPAIYERKNPLKKLISQLRLLTVIPL